MIIRSKFMQQFLLIWIWKPVNIFSLMPLSNVDEIKASSNISTLLILDLHENECLLAAYELLSMVLIHSQSTGQFAYSFSSQQGAIIYYRPTPSALQTTCNNQLYLASEKYLNTAQFSVTHLYKALAPVRSAHYAVSLAPVFVDLVLIE